MTTVLWCLQMKGGHSPGECPPPTRPCRPTPAPRPGARPPPPGGDLHALLPPPRRGLSGRGRRGPSPGPGPSQWGALATTAGPGQRASVARIVPVRAGLAAGLGRRGPACVCAVDPPPGLQGLGEAADQRRACAHPVRHAGRGGHVQRAALFARLRAAEARAHLERSPAWGGGALAPASKRRRRDRGEPPLVRAHRLGPHVAPVGASDWAPLVLTAGVRASLTAWLTHAGPWGPPGRQPAPGPAPQPRWRPRPGRLAAPVVQPVRRRRLGRVRHRVGCGTLAAVPAVWAPLGGPLTPACMERRHLSMRPPGAAGGRRGATLGTGEDGGRPLGSGHLCVKLPPLGLIARQSRT